MVVVESSVSWMDTLSALSSQPIFIGFVMSMLNLGGRFLAVDLPPAWESWFQNMWLRRLIWFCLFFMATRSFKTALFMTFMYTIAFRYLLNEMSAVRQMMVKDEKKVTTG